jgi:plasmid stabilization system protein ParE
MTLEVVLTETARRPLESAADWYAKQNPAVAATWFNGLIQRLNALAENPGAILGRSRNRVSPC